MVEGVKWDISLFKRSMVEMRIGIMKGERYVCKSKSRRYGIFGNR